MSCYHPLYRASFYALPLRLQTSFFKLLHNGGVVVSREAFENFSDGESQFFSPIPCGKCLGCRLDFSRQWADRVTLESMLYPEEFNHSLTVTFDEDHITPFSVRRYFGEDSYQFFHRLELRPIQLFMKRLRVKLERELGWTQPIRYIYAGEYGDKNGRPHYHVQLLNCPLPDLKRSERFFSSFRPLQESNFLDECWSVGRGRNRENLGGIAVGNVTWASSAYVARYVFKKQIVSSGEYPFDVVDLDTGEFHSHQEKPYNSFFRMSRNPGIASRYFDEHKNDIFLTGKIPVVTSKGVQYHSCPRYFRRKLQDLAPKHLDEIEDERKAVAIARRQLELERTSLSEVEYLNQQEQIKYRQLQRLVRPLD